MSNKFDEKCKLLRQILNDTIKELNNTIPKANEFTQKITHDELINLMNCGIDEYEPIRKLRFGSITFRNIYIQRYDIDLKPHNDKYTVRIKVLFV